MPAGATEASAFPARKSGRPRRTPPADTDKAFRGRHFPEDFPQRKLREPPTTRDGPGRIARKAPAPAAKRKGGREPLTAPACRGASRTDGRRVRRAAQARPMPFGGTRHGKLPGPETKRRRAPENFGRPSSIRKDRSAGRNGRERSAAICSGNRVSLAPCRIRRPCLCRPYPLSHRVCRHKVSQRIPSFRSRLPCSRRKPPFCILPRKRNRRMRLSGSIPSGPCRIFPAGEPEPSPR